MLEVLDRLGETKCGSCAYRHLVCENRDVIGQMCLFVCMKKQGLAGVAKHV